MRRQSGILWSDIVLSLAFFPGYKFLMISSVNDCSFTCLCLFLFIRVQIKSGFLSSTITHARSVFVRVIISECMCLRVSPKNCVQVWKLSFLDFEGALPIQQSLSFCGPIKTGMMSYPTVKMIASIRCRPHSEKELEVIFRNSGAAVGGARCMNDEIYIAHTSRGSMPAPSSPAYREKFTRWAGRSVQVLAEDTLV